MLTLARWFPAPLEQNIFDCETGQVAVDLYIKYLPILSFLLKVEDLQFQIKLFPSVESLLGGGYFRLIFHRFSKAAHLQILDLMLAETRFNDLLCKYNSDYIYESKQKFFKAILNEIGVSARDLIEICIGGGFLSLLDAWAAFEGPEMRHCEHMIAYSTADSFLYVVRILLSRFQFTTEAFESLLTLAFVSDRLKSIARQVFEVVKHIPFKKQSIYGNSFTSIVHWRNISREPSIFKNEDLIIVPIYLCRQFGIAPFSVQLTPRERQVFLWDDLIAQAQLCLYASHYDQSRNESDIVTIT